MRQPIVAGNWKMNGDRAQSSKLVNDIKNALDTPIQAQVVLCPPHILIPLVHEQIQGTNISLGGQNLDVHDEGAFTGEVSGPMLVDFGCNYCIVGHSERRAYYADTNELVAEKFAVAQKHGLIPILCVGETLEQREKGMTEPVVDAQLDAVLGRVSISGFKQAVIAYEPVWAIGTGKTATPEQAQQVHAHIREKLAALDAEVASNVRILYGGSVKADNAASLFSKADIDGGLIGGASLEATQFVKICQSC